VIPAPTRSPLDEIASMSELNRRENQILDALPGRIVDEPNEDLDLPPRRFAGACQQCHRDHCQRIAKLVPKHRQELARSVYRRGKTGDWIKVKTTAGKALIGDRGKWNER
jgi:hypothetical protein